MDTTQTAASVDVIQTSASADATKRTTKGSSDPNNNSKLGIRSYQDRAKFLLFCDQITNLLTFSLNVTPDIQTLNEATSDVAQLTVKVHIQDISPLPKASESVNKRQSSRRSSWAPELMASPYEQMLESNLNAKQYKLKPKAKKRIIKPVVPSKRRKISHPKNPTHSPESDRSDSASLDSDSIAGLNL